MQRDHVARCVAVLLRLAGCRRSSATPSPVSEIDLSQDATLANVARTTAGAVMRNLETAGHIEQAYRRIRILAPDALRAMLRDWLWLGYRNSAGHGRCDRTSGLWILIL
jgi:CRP/FNR family transcriptional regulator, cyclic AMP receptor protein